VHVEVSMLRVDPHPRSGLVPAIATALLVLSALPAATAPQVDLSWDSCSPLVTARKPVPGETVVDLYVSVTGLEQAHKGYVANVVFTGNSPCRQIMAAPDAWRFDPEGCQATLGTISFTAPSKTCPPLHGNAPLLFTVQDFHVDEQDLSGAMVAFGAAAYPQHVQVPDPNQRYVMMRIRFDLGDAVEGPGEPGLTCGGLETPMCFSLRTGYQYTVQGECGIGIVGTEVNFVNTSDQQVGIAPGQWYASFGLEPGSSMKCFEFTPARPSTWGEVKARYHD
jgi:hypothetical protein